MSQIDRTADSLFQRDHVVDAGDHDGYVARQEVTAWLRICA